MDFSSVSYPNPSDLSSPPSAPKWSLPSAAPSSVSSFIPQTVQEVPLSSVLVSFSSGEMPKPFQAHPPLPMHNANSVAAAPLSSPTYHDHPPASRPRSSSVDTLSSLNGPHDPTEEVLHREGSSSAFPTSFVPSMAISPLPIFFSTSPHPSSRSSSSCPPTPVVEVRPDEEWSPAFFPPGRGSMHEREEGSQGLSSRPPLRHDEGRPTARGSTSFPNHHRGDAKTEEKNSKGDEPQSSSRDDSSCPRVPKMGGGGGGGHHPSAVASTRSIPETSPHAPSFVSLLPPADTPLFSIVPAFSAVSSTLFMANRSTTEAVGSAGRHAKETPEVQDHDNAPHANASADSHCPLVRSSSCRSLDDTPIENVVFTLASLHRLLQQHAAVLCRQYRRMVPSHSVATLRSLSLLSRSSGSRGKDWQDGRESRPPMAVPARQWCEEEGKRTASKGVVLPPNRVVLQAVAHLQQLLHRRGAGKRGRWNASTPHTPSRGGHANGTTSAMTNTSRPSSSGTGNTTHAENRKGKGRESHEGEKEEDQWNPSILPNDGLCYTDALEVLVLLQFLTWYCLESTAMQLQAKEDDKEEEGWRKGGSEASSHPKASHTPASFSSAASTSLSSPFFFFLPSPSAVTSPAGRPRFASGLGRRPLLPDGFLAPPVARWPHGNASSSGVVPSPILSSSSSFAVGGDDGEEEEEEAKKTEGRFVDVWHRPPRSVGVPSSGGRRSPERTPSRTRTAPTSANRWESWRHVAIDDAEKKVTTPRQEELSHVDPHRVGGASLSSFPPSSSMTSFSSSSSSVWSANVGRQEEEEHLRMRTGAEGAAPHPKDGLVSSMVEDDHRRALDESEAGYEEEWIDEAAQESRGEGIPDAQCAERLFACLLGEEWLIHLAKATGVTGAEPTEEGAASGEAKEKKEVLPPTRASTTTMGRTRPEDERRQHKKGEAIPSPSIISSLLVALHFYSLALLAVALVRYDAVANGIFLTRLFSPVDPSDLFLTAVPSHVSFPLHSTAAASSTSSASSSSPPSAVSPGNAKKGKEAPPPPTRLVPPPPPSVVSLPYATPRHPLLFPYLYSPSSAIRWAAGLTLQHVMRYLSCFLIAEEPQPSRRGGSSWSASGGLSQAIYSTKGNRPLTVGTTPSTAMTPTWASPSSFVPLSVHSGLLLLQLHAIACWMLSAAEASPHTVDGHVLSSSSPLFSLETKGLLLLSSPSTFPLLWQLMVTIISVTPYRRCPSSLERVRVLLSLFSTEKSAFFHGGENMVGKPHHTRPELPCMKDPPPSVDATVDAPPKEGVAVVGHRRHRRQRRKQHMPNDADSTRMAPWTPSSSSSSLLLSSSHWSIPTRVLGDNLCRQAVVAFVAQCICRVHYPSASLLSGEGREAGGDSGGGGGAERERGGVMDLRRMFSSGKKGSFSSSSSSSSPAVPGRPPKEEGKGRGGGGTSPQTILLTKGCRESEQTRQPTDLSCESRLCDALFGLSAWSVVPRDRHVGTTEGPPMDRHHAGGEGGYVFSSVDWLCMTAFLRFFPDLLEPFPYRLEELLYQTTCTLERFYLSYYGTSSSLVSSCTTSSVAHTHPVTAASAAAALAEALRCWNHFIGYVWTSFDGKSDDLARLHPLPPAVTTSGSSDNNASSVALTSSAGRASVSSKCVLYACVFLPIWRCLLRLYQRHLHGETWRVDRHPAGDTIGVASTTTMGEKEALGAVPDLPPSSSSSSSLSLPPIPVVRMALRAAANLSDECVVIILRTTGGVDIAASTPFPSATAPPPRPFTADLPMASIVSRWGTAMSSGKPFGPEEDGLQEVMLPFVRYCLTLDPRTEVRVEALQTIGVWCWAYPSLDAMLLRSGLYRWMVDVLRADTDVICRSKAAWALSNLCVRLADRNATDGSPSPPPRTTDDVSSSLLCPTAIGDVVPEAPESPPPTKEREGMQEGRKDEEKVDSMISTPHSSPPSFSLRDQPLVIQWMCEAALCATSLRMQRQAENVSPSTGYGRSALVSSSSSSFSSSSSSSATSIVNAVIHHGIRMMRALLQLLTVEECLQCAPKCPMDANGMIGTEDERRGGVGGGEFSKNRTPKRSGVHQTILEDEEEEVVIEAFLSRLTRFLSTSRDVKLRWNVAMALGVAISRKDIFEAEPLGTSSVILLLCDILQRDTFFKVRIRVVEALGGACLEGLQGEYSAHGDHTPMVIQAMCDALKKCQSSTFPPGHQGEDTLRHHDTRYGAHGRVGERVWTSQRDSDAIEGVPSAHSLPHSGTLETATMAPGTLTPSHAPSSSVVVPATPFSSPSVIEQGRQELHRVTVATIAKILRTAKPSAALDCVLKRNSVVLKREELA